MRMRWSKRTEFWHTVDLILAPFALALLVFVFLIAPFL